MEREVGGGIGRGNTCKPMAASFQCMTKSTTIKKNNNELIAKFRLKLKKVGKITRLFWYDLNQISYNYTMEVTNRFKGFKLIRVPEELWMEVQDIIQEMGIKIIPKKKKWKKGKWLSEEAL